MQNQELETIANFLSFATPVVTGLVTAALKSYSWQVKQEGQGLELVYLIKVDEKEIQFHLHNLLLEIATPDRDQQPLQFDEGLRYFDYFLDKTIRLIQSKFRVLSHLLGEDDIDAAIDNISQDAKQYERIRIWQFDKPDKT